MPVIRNSREPRDCRDLMCVQASTGRKHNSEQWRIRMRKFIIGLSALGLIAGSAPSSAAAPCRDAKGKFVKCAKAAPAKPTRCRDAKGHYAKCGTPGAKPA